MLKEQDVWQNAIKNKSDESLNWLIDWFELILKQPNNSAKKN